MNRNVKIAIGIVGAILLILLAWKFSYIIVYLLIAGVLSLMGAPIMRWLGTLRIGKYKLSAPIRAVSTIAIFYLIVAFFFMLFAPKLFQQGKVLTTLDWPQIGQSIEQTLDTGLEYLKDKNIIGEEFNVEEVVKEQAEKFFSLGKVEQIIGGTLGGLTSFLAGIFAVTFILFFFLKDEGLFYNIILGLTPDKIEKRVLSSLSTIEHLLTRYVVGIAIQVGLFTLMVWIMASVVGLKNALLIAFVAGIFNLIPYIGPPLGFVFAAIVYLSSSFTGTFDPNTGKVLLSIGAIFAIAQFIDNTFVQPKIFGDAVKAHPIEIFIVILIAGGLGGILGMLIAIPVYTIARVIGKEFFSEFKPVRQLTKNV